MNMYIWGHLARYCCEGILSSVITQQNMVCVMFLMEMRREVYFGIDMTKMVGVKKCENYNLTL